MLGIMEVQGKSHRHRTLESRQVLAAVKCPTRKGRSFSVGPFSTRQEAEHGVIHRTA